MSRPKGFAQTSFAGAYAAYSITHDLGFCGLLNMVTFDGDVGIVFVEAYNYLSDLSILVQIICRNWIFWRELFVGFEYFSVNYLSDLDI